MTDSPHKLPNPESRSRLGGWRKIFPLVEEWRDGTTSLHLLWGELAAWLAAALLVAYVGAAATLWVFLKYERGITAASFGDLLLPSRWAHHRHVVGEHYVALGQRELAAGDARRAFHSLTLGVARSPGNAAGRVILAQLLAAGGRPELAGRTLLAGLPYSAHDPVFLRSLFTFLLQQQEDDQVRLVARQLLADPGLPPECSALAALAAATACYFRGNYDQADDLLNSHGLALTPDGRLLAIQIDWDRGYRDLALVQLRALADEFPAHEPIHVQLGQWLHETGRADEFRRLSVVRQLANPQNPGPRIDFLRALRDGGDTARFDREIDNLLRDFAGDERTLAALAEFAANAGDPALARRVYRHCRTAGLPWQAPAFLTIEALIVAHDYHGSLDLIRTLLDENPNWSGTYRSLLDSFQAIAHYGLGDPTSGRLYLTNFLNRPEVRAENLLAVAQRLAELGARTEARDTLARAVAADPLNQAALTRLVEIELDLNQMDALPAQLARLLAMRKPSPATLRAAQHKLGGDRFLFARDRESTLAALDHTLAGAR